MFDTSCWLNIAGILKRKEKRKKELFLKSHHYLFGCRLSKFCWYLNVPFCWNLLDVISAMDTSSFVCISFSPVSLSLILAKRLIATLKYYEIILEVLLQLMFSNPEIRFPYIWGGRKRRTRWVMGRWIGYPLTSVGVQSSPKLTPSLFAGLPYPRNRRFN